MIISSTFIHVTTKPISIVVGVVFPVFLGLIEHILSLVVVGTGAHYRVMVPVCSALVFCIVVRMPRIVEILGVDMKVGDLGDCQL